MGPTVVVVVNSFKWIHKQVREVVAVLDEQALYQTLGDETNSIMVLIRHMHGSEGEAFRLVTSVSGVCDRPAEFRETAAKLRGIRSAGGIGGAPGHDHSFLKATPPSGTSVRVSESTPDPGRRQRPLKEGWPTCYTGRVPGQASGMRVIRRHPDPQSRARTPNPGLAPLRHAGISQA